MRSKPEAIRRLRQLQGQTVTAFAEQCGVSKQWISELERDALGLLPPTAKRIADALGVEIEDIATITDEPAAEVAS